MDVQISLLHMNIHRYKYIIRNKLSRVLYISPKENDMRNISSTCRRNFKYQNKPL